MKHYELILFDLDGTITDSAEGIINCVEHALRQMGRDVPQRSSLYRFIGPPLMDSFRNFCGMDNEQAAEATRLYRERYKNIGIFENAVYSGAAEMLARIRAAGRRTALATSKPEVYARRIISHFCLDEYFDFVGGAEMTGERTNKAAVIRYVMKSCGAEADKTLMVGDRHHDIEGAAAEGIDSLGVLYGYGSKEELEKAGADYIAETPAQTADIILA